jgi:hypothetical protein
MLRPIEERLCGWVKPRGGFWTSSLTDTGRSGWIDWCLSEGYQGPEFDLWHLDPDPDARVYTIDTYDDLLRLGNRYPPVCDHERECDRLSLGSGVGWRQVATDYDAVRVTEEGQWATRLSHPFNLYGWDCEATVWFRWRFTAVRHLGIQRFEHEEALDG